MYKPALSLLRLIFNGNEQQLQLDVTQPGKEVQPLKSSTSRCLMCSNLWNSNPKCSYSSSCLHCRGISHPPVEFAERYLLADGGEREAHKGTGQILCVHLIRHAFQIILLPCVLFNLAKDNKHVHVTCEGNEGEKKKSSKVVFPSTDCPIWPADVPPHISLWMMR